MTNTIADASKHFSLANALLQAGKLDEARAAYELCLRLQPDHAGALINLGFVFGEQGKPEEALARYERALELRPEVPEVHHNRANILRERGQMDEAVAGYREALRLRPGYARAHLNLGVALLRQTRLAQAEASIREALKLQPDLPEHHNSLGAALSMQGKCAEAIVHYRAALQLNPGSAETHWNLGLALLQSGNLAEGWPEFEWIWKCKSNALWLALFPQPRWDGTPLYGKRIVLHDEQGLGDAFHFIRYAPLVKERGGKVIVYCQVALRKILERCQGIDQIVPRGDPVPEHDCQASLQSLPGIFGTTLDSIPAQLPYLFADPERVEHWRRELAGVPGFKVGIAWQGHPNNPWDRHRSIPLTQFEPLARVEGVRLLSLQKVFGLDQIAKLDGRFPVLDLDKQIDEANGPFLDTAAIIKNLDLVITTDTAIAHLAGALAAPVWVALCSTCDWRWLLARPDSPWYPTMRLFRQSTLGDWGAVFEQMAAALKKKGPDTFSGESRHHHPLPASSIAATS